MSTESATIQLPEATKSDFGQTLGEADKGGFLSRVIGSGDGKAPKEDAPQPAEPAKVNPHEPAKTESPDRAAEEDGEIPPEIKSPKAREDWKTVKSARDQARREADEYKAKLEKYEQQLAQRAEVVPEEVSKKLEALEKERDELSDRLRLVDVERHPKFQAYFEGKSQRLMELAKNIVGAEHAEKVERITKIADAEQRGQMLDDLISDLRPSQQTRLGAVVANIEALQQERAAEIGNSKTLWEQLQQETKAQQQASLRERQEQADRLVAAASDLDAFKAGEKPSAERISQIETYKGFVRGAILGQIGEKDLQLMPLAAVEGLHLKTSVLPALTKEIADLKAQLERFQTAQPRPSGAGNQSRDGAVPKSFLEMVTKGA